MNASEIAHLRQKIAEEYQAAESALFGLTRGLARHQFITVRMENMQRYQEQLTVVLGGDQQESTRLVVETLNSVTGQTV